jgi:hypothetical protein
MDILVKADRQNAERILAALDDFGFGELELSMADFERLILLFNLG